MRDREFFKAACHQYLKTGTLWASSRWVSRRIARKLRADMKYVVELGAGSGAVTRELLERLEPDGRLVAVEILPELIPELRALPDDRLRVLAGDAQRLLSDGRRFGLPRVDAIVSGIPLSFLEPAERRNFVSRAAAILDEGGRFITYQVSPISFGLLKKHFSRVQISFDARNLPPYFIAVAD